MQYAFSYYLHTIYLHFLGSRVLGLLPPPPPPGALSLCSSAREQYHYFWNLLLDHYFWNLTVALERLGSSRVFYDNSAVEQSLRVRFVGGLNKLKEQKMVGIWKSKSIEKILIFLIFVWLGVEKWRDEKNVFV